MSEELPSSKKKVGLQYSRSLPECFTTCRLCSAPLSPLQALRLVISCTYYPEFILSIDSFISYTPPLHCNVESVLFNETFVNSSFYILRSSPFF